MLIQEMHIGIDLELRKVNSARLGNLESEEKDFILNNVIKQFAKTRRNPKANPSGKGYEQNKKRYDDLEELGESLTLPVYYKDAISQYSILPYNYFLMDKDHSNLLWDCKPQTSTIGTTTLYYIVVPMPTGGSTFPYYSGFKLQTIDNVAVVTTIFDIANYATISSGLNSTEEGFYITNLVLETLNSNGLDTRWERWNTRTILNSFIIQVPSTIVSIALTVNGVTTSYNTQTTVLPTITSTGNASLVANRQMEREDIIQSLNHPFRKSTPISPISELERRNLIVYHDNSFVINSTYIKYIRKPQRVDLKLGYSCDLNADVHEEIVNLTVQKLKAILESPSYKEIINENLIQE